MPRGCLPSAPGRSLACVRPGPIVNAAWPPACVGLSLSWTWNPRPAHRCDSTGSISRLLDLYSCVHESRHANGQSRPGFVALPAVNAQTSRRRIKSDRAEGSGPNWRRAIGHPVRSPRPSSSGTHRCLFRLTRIIHDDWPRFRNPRQALRFGRCYGWSLFGQVQQQCLKSKKVTSIIQGSRD